jgi:arylsulfatase
VPAGSERRAILGAALLAGALAGTVDTLLTLAGTPDLGNATFRLGLLLGPVPNTVAWAVPLGYLASLCARRRRAAVAAGTVAGLWAAGLLHDAWLAWQSPAALAVLALAIGLGALAVTRLALDGAAAVEGLAARSRRLVWAFAALAFVVTSAASLPAAVATAMGGTGPCPVDGAPPPRGPNVLLLTVDALRADAARGMQSYQRLAATGIEFGQHLTDAPWTLPSVAALLSGLPTHRHGAGIALSPRSLAAKSPLPAGMRTIAGALGARGYLTHAVVTNPFLTPQYGIDQGFCSFENVTMSGELARALAHTTPVRLARAFVPRLLPSDRADRVRARVERWLAAHGDRPFFLWVHLLDPHAPYGDRDGASTSLTLDLMAFQKSGGPAAPFHQIGLLRAGEYRPTREEQHEIAGLYQEDVTFTDRQIGLLLDALEGRGLTGRTAVVLTADHGEEFWEHGGVEHGRTLYDEVLRVPLVVVPAGGVQRAVRAEMSTVVDVAPTLLALAGVEESGWAGRSLLAAANETPPALALGNLLFGEEWSGVRTPGLKYMRSEHGEERLYDLARDPDEHVNAVAAMPEALTRVRGLLRPEPRSSRTQAAHVGASTEALRALGYVR